MIYIAQEKSSENIKIGFTDRLTGKRIQEIQVCNSDQILVLAIIPVGGKDLEKVLHDICAEYAIRGEWFTKHALGALLNVSFVRSCLYDEEYLNGCLSCSSLNMAAKILVEDWPHRVFEIRSKLLDRIKHECLATTSARYSKRNICTSAWGHINTNPTGSVLISRCRIPSNHE